MRHDAFVENSRLLSWLRTQLSQTKSMQSAVNTTQVKLAKYTSLKSHFRIRVKQTLNNLVTELPRFFFCCYILDPLTQALCIFSPRISRLEVTMQNVFGKSSGLFKIERGVKDHFIGVFRERNWGVATFFVDFHGVKDRGCL